MKLRLKQKFFLSFIITFFTLSKIYGQQLSLKIDSKIESEKRILSKINFQEKHKDSISLYKEVERISTLLKREGFFTNKISLIKKEKLNYTVFYELGKKIEKIILFINKKNRLLLDLDRNKERTEVKTKELEDYLNTLSLILDKKGKSFSKIKLSNFLIKGNTLNADLYIKETKERFIDDIIIKGYTDFPKSYLKNYYKINSKSYFSKQKLNELSLKTKSLKFTTEVKPPEVLFTKDSTKLYLYLKKIKNNSFDGILNVGTKENGDILLNGYLDLKLNNTFNTGESFNLFWNRINEERQEFKVNTFLPYIFNSKISTDFSFSIYKQDSTFLNTTFNSKIYYNINNKTNLAITYDSEKSDNLLDNTFTDIESYNSKFIGIEFKYTIPNNDFFRNNKFLIAIKLSFGKRETLFSNTNQQKIKTSISYLFSLNRKNQLYLSNEFGFLNSDNYLDNELYRIGGINSIRGFAEQSVFTNNYTFFNIEYRFLTSNKSYLYSITDIGRTKTKQITDNLFGFGLGYLFSTKNSLIDLSIVTNKSNERNLKFQNALMNLKWTSFF